jgi:peptide/nickel transport system permease protein
MGIGRLLSQGVFIEIVFSRPGLGRLIYGAISDRNYPVVQGAVLVVDLSYSAIDPRIRQGGGAGG